MAVATGRVAPKNPGMRRFLFVVLAACCAVAFPRAEDAPAATEELPPLEGLVIDRPDGTFITVSMDGVFLVLKFFDEKHLPAQTDFTRGFVRVQPPGRRPENVALRRMEDGASLRSSLAVRKPHVFRLLITLSKGEEGNEDGSESYQVNYP
jgi:hypothetical protein